MREKENYIDDRPLNVLLYTNSFLPQVGGREIVVYHLAKSLADAGHTVRVVCPGGWISQRKLSYPFPVHRLPSIPGLSLVHSSQINLAINVAWYGCDVINAHATFPAGYVALKNKTYSNTPLVITPHGEDIHVIPEINHGLRLIPEVANKIDKVVNGAERLTAISESVVMSLQAANAPVNRIVDIPNGVDFTRFSSEQTLQIRERFGISPAKRILLTVGNYVRRRGHEELIESMRYIVDGNSDAHLVIVGRGTEVLQARIIDLGLLDHITLTGAIAPIESDSGVEDVVAALYRDSEIYVAPGMSEGSEGLSLALLDAMAAGSAIVATEISGNRDVIVDGKNGLLVSPGESEALAKAVLHMLSQKDLQSACRDNAFKDVQPYSWKSIAQQYVETYRDAISLSRRTCK